MIKCNINRMTGEKIYHLPFDINYDKTVIDPAHGEFYAATIHQAESAGSEERTSGRGTDR